MSSPSEGSSGRPQGPQERAAARATLLQLLKRNPGRAELYNLLGALAIEDQQLGDAVDAFQKAVELSPNQAEYWSNLGESLRRAGRQAEAIGAIQRAVKLSPGRAEPHFNLGVMLLAEKRFEESAAAFALAIQCDSRFALAHERRGHALAMAGKWSEAVECCRVAAGLQPRSPDMWIGLATAQLGGGSADQAASTLRQAIDTCGATAAILNNLADLLRNCCQLDEAIDLWQQAIELDPKDVKIHTNLVYFRLYHAASSWQMIRDEQAKWVHRHARPLIPAKPPRRRSLAPGVKLRIGYITPYFRNHVLAQNMWPLFANHDRQRFEIFCYSDADSPDAMTQRFQSAVDHWRETGNRTDAELTEQIRADEVDILVDLSQHMANNRLLVFARMAAAVQISFAGYPASTGLPTIPFRVSDPILEPPGDRGWKNEWERVLYLRSYWCYHPLEQIPVEPLPAEERGAITFGCLNAPFKIDPTVLGVWAAVMQRVPGSTLQLRVWSEHHRQRLTQILAEQGISADRLTFLMTSGHASYMRQYNNIDIMLDSWPYNGHTTSMDAMWMGVPVVTLMGQTPVGRAGLSQLTNLQMTELVAHSAEQFVEIAAALATDIKRLAEIRAGLRQRMQQSALMDAVGFARQVEEAYETAWQDSP